MMTQPSLTQLLGWPDGHFCVRDSQQAVSCMGESATDGGRVLQSLITAALTTDLCRKS
jgi:hypothetical protein